MFLLVTPRPQDLSYLFFAALLLLLTLARQRTIWLVAVPPLLLIWANVHGSFLLGLGIIALELIWSVFPRLKGRLRVSQRLPVKAVGLTLVGEPWRHVGEPPWAVLVDLRLQGQLVPGAHVSDSRVAEPRFPFAVLACGRSSGRSCCSWACWLSRRPFLPWKTLCSPA